MNGFVEHLINSDAEVQSELSLDSLNESMSVDAIIDDELDLDSEFSNEQEPGDLGGNIDGITNLGDDVEDTMEGDDEWEEHSSDLTDDLEGFEDLDESFEEDEDLGLEEACTQTMQAYQGIEDEDFEDEMLFQKQQKRMK